MAAAISMELGKVRSLLLYNFSSDSCELTDDGKSPLSNSGQTFKRFKVVFCFVVFNEVINFSAGVTKVTDRMTHRKYL